MELKMITFSARFTLIFFLSVNSAFIAAGIGMISYGIYKKSTNPDHIASDFEGSQSDGTTNIVAGCLDIFIGVCGLTGTLMKKRLLLLANTALLLMAIIGNIVMMIVIGVSGSRLVTKATANIKLAIINQYGLNGDRDSRVFTDDINKFHNMENCCGWSGIDGENLFLKSPWHSAINTNATGLRRTLPDSCCTTNVDECRATNNVKEARDKGLVNRADCMDTLMGRVKFFIGLSITQLIIVTLVQAAVVAFSVLTFLLGIRPE